MITSRDVYRKGHLTAVPDRLEQKEVPFTGLNRLELSNSKKENLIYVPKSYHPGTPAPLALMLHGAGGNAAHGMSLLRDLADRHNIILVAPASQDYSWDLIAANAFGPDVMLIDAALEATFRDFSIHPSCMAIGGFSDGASYALSLGLGNGHLFTDIIAFSPGFFRTVESRGTLRVFLSHGTFDHVLPINACSRRIVPRLQHQGIPVLYQEFEGEHIIPDPVKKAAVNWFLEKT